jgi:hypothetical protein
MNMWGLHPQIFEALEKQFVSFLDAHGSGLKSECYLPNAMNALVAAGHALIRVLRASDAWFGVTYREDHAHVVEKIARLSAQGQYPESLWL